MAAIVFDGAEEGLGPLSTDFAGLDACLRRTFGPRIIPSHDSAALIRLNPGGMFGRPLRDPVLASSARMAGAWLRPSLDAGHGGTAGMALVADCVNELIRVGAFPLSFMMCAASGGAPAESVQEMADGAAEACRAADCAFVGMDAPGRETAPGPAVASGFAVGVVERQRRVDNLQTIRAGDAVIGVTAGGLCGAERCAVERLMPGAWHDAEPLPELGGSLAQALAAPPKVFARAMSALFRAYRRKRVPTGVAVVGQGGLPGALLHALPPGCGARVKLDSWPRPPLFTVIQRMAGLDLESALRQFGLGLGLLIFAPAFFAPAVVRKLARQRAHACVIGEVTEDAGRVEVE